jgi:hypothetical protein
VPPGLSIVATFGMSDKVEGFDDFGGGQRGECRADGERSRRKIRPTLTLMLARALALPLPLLHNAAI